MDWQMLMTSLWSTSWVTWLITFALVMFVCLLRLTEPWLNLPPGPHALPIVGSLPFLGDRDPLKAFEKLSNKYGNIFTVYFGNTRAIVFNGYDVIKDALKKQGTTFEGRPKVFSAEACTGSKGIGTTQGEVWREQRRFVLHQLRNYGLGRSLMEDVIQEEIFNLTKEIKPKANNPYCLTPLLQKAAFNILSHITFWERFEYDNPKFLELVETTNEYLSLQGSDSLVNVFPTLRYLPGDVIGYKAMMRCSRFMMTQFQTWIDDHMIRISNGDVPDDLLGAYLVEMNKQQGKEDTTFTESQLKGVMNDMTVAGIDTTSATLAWALLYMIRNPHIQEKVHTAIDDLIGRERAPSMSNRTQLPYIEAVLAEVMRIATVAPLSVPHAPLEDAVFRGYTIPKGTLIIINARSVFMDEQLWSCPREFQPERFLDDQGLYKPREEHFPFSMGKRQCPGEGLARMELFLIFTSLLQQFKFSVPDGATIPDNIGVFGFTYSPKPYHVKLELRI